MSHRPVSRGKESVILTHGLPDTRPAVHLWQLPPDRRAGAAPSGSERMRALFVAIVVGSL
jgi:hypothetical protein